MKTAETELAARLDEFVARHPHGWQHHEWLGLLSDLAEAGVDTSDAEGIGATLEQHRLHAVLEGLGVKGLGPKRRQAVVDRFSHVWNLRQATVEQITEVPSFHRRLAAELHEALH